MISGISHYISPPHAASVMTASSEVSNILHTGNLLEYPGWMVLKFAVILQIEQNSTDPKGADILHQFWVYFCSARWMCSYHCFCIAMTRKHRPLTYSFIKFEKTMKKVNTLLSMFNFRTHTD